MVDKQKPFDKIFIYNSREINKRELFEFGRASAYSPLDHVTLFLFIESINCGSYHARAQPKKYTIFYNVNAKYARSHSSRKRSSIRFIHKWVRDAGRTICDGVSARQPHELEWNKGAMHLM